MEEIKRNEKKKVTDKIGSKSYLVKQLEEVKISVNSSQVFSLCHKETGVFHEFKNDRCVDLNLEDKKEYLELFLEELEKENKTIKSRNFMYEYFKFAEKYTCKEIEMLLSKVKKNVDECFKNRKGCSLEIGEILVRVDSYCTFELKENKVWLTMK